MEDLDLLAALEPKKRLGFSEKTVQEGDQTHVVKKQRVDDVFWSVKATAQIHQDDNYGSKKVVGSKYVGSIDMLTAANMAKECGAAIGSAEFNAYVVRCLKNTHQKFAAASYQT